MIAEAVEVVIAVGTVVNVVIVEGAMDVVIVGAAEVEEVVGPVTFLLNPFRYA